MGEIGRYYGAKLAYGGSDVHFLMRGDLSGVREPLGRAAAAGANTPRLEMVYALLNALDAKRLGKRGPPDEY
jgi:ketopantoate reductase